MMEPVKKTMQKMPAKLPALLFCALALAWFLSFRPPSDPKKMLVLAQHSDMSTNNPWTAWGPRTSIWNSYPSGGLYPSVYTTVSPTWQFVPFLARHPVNIENLPRVPVKDVFPSGPPARRAEDFSVNGRPAETLLYVDVEIHDFVRWSDNEPVTARDVAFTHNITLELGPMELGGNHPTFTPPEVLAKAEALDDFTVRYYLIRKDARFLFGVLTRPVLPSHYWEPIIKGFIHSDDPVFHLFSYEDTYDEPSAGPFLRGRWERGAFVHRKANHNYSFRHAESCFYGDLSYRFRLPERGIDVLYHGPGEGEPWLELSGGPFADEVLYSIYSDQSSAVMALARGDVHFMLNPSGIEIGFKKQLENHPGVSIITNLSYGFRYMAFNMRKAPFDDLNFRKAVATMIDRDFLTENILQGAAVSLSTVMPPGNAFWHNSGVPVYGDGFSRAMRAEESVRILKNAGYTWLSEPEIDLQMNRVSKPGLGLIMPDGSPVEPFEMLSPGYGYDPLRAVFAAWIERWCREIGIPLRAKFTDFGLISEMVFRRQEFDAWMLGWSLGNPAFPTFFDAFFHSKNAYPGGMNAQGYSNPEYDSLTEEFLSLLCLDEAREIAFRLQEIIAEELPYIVLFDTPIVEAYRSDGVKYPYTEVLGGLQFLSGMVSDAKLID